MDEQSPVGGPDDSQRPELHDIARLGRRLLRKAVSAARADEVPTLRGLLAGHLGAEVGSLPVVGEGWRDYEHVNLQVALDLWLAAAGRAHQLVGVVGWQQRPPFSLSDLAQGGLYGHGLGIGSPALTRLASGPNGETYNCVRCGVYLVEEDDLRLGLLVRQNLHGNPREPALLLEVMCADGDRGSEVLVELRKLADLHNVFRGQVLSFQGTMFGPGGAVLNFMERPRVPRQALVLPELALARIEQQVLGIARHRTRLVASGQHLKRGLLLYGPPGTGKTHTVRYLLGKTEDTTVIVLSGPSLGLVGEACQVARALQPALVVVEDVDLIAEERGMRPGAQPLLFQLLNEMDGLEQDLDVTFLLTTNRADLLEPALAERPGRVDQAIEFQLPDAPARLQLLELYKGKLDLRMDRVQAVLDRTEGTTAPFLKELLRRAALAAASETSGEPTAPITVDDHHLHLALDELLDQREGLARVLFGGAGGEGDQGWSASGAQPPTAPPRRGSNRSPRKGATP
jgi:hypothetical protein